MGAACGSRKKGMGRQKGGLYRVVGLPGTNVSHIFTGAYLHPVQMCHICTRYKCGYIFTGVAPTRYKCYLTRHIGALSFPLGTNDIIYIRCKNIGYKYVLS
jgi:hypothetical protein